MSHNVHTASNRHQEREDGLTLMECLRLTADWEDPFPTPIVEQRSEGCLVVREDKLEVGSKARFGHCLLQSINPDQPIVYVAPRYGFAAISLAYLAKMMNRQLVLFMPACKQISDHQAYAISLGAEPRFLRIAAMPVLNKYAKEWANANDSVFIPLGLRHRLVTAAIVRTAHKMFTAKDHPKAFWCAMSTGVLCRALQIAWPRASPYGVAVSRNIKEGEKGNALIFSHPLAFAANAMTPPPFMSAPNYDAKVWDFMTGFDVTGHLFWNVAGEVCAPTDEFKMPDSDVPWKDMSGLSGL